LPLYVTPTEFFALIIISLFSINVSLQIIISILDRLIIKKITFSKVFTKFDPLFHDLFILFMYMVSIDRVEIQFLTNRIITKFVKWHESKYCFPPRKLDFKSYLNGYSSLCLSFDEIIGEHKVSDNTLRNLFYYARNCESIRFRDTTIDYFYFYFSGKTKNGYYSKGISTKLVVSVENEFDNEFQFWRLDHQYFMDQRLLKKVLKLMDLSLFDEEKMAFVIMNVVHYGERSINLLLCKNKNNQHV